MPEGLEVYVLSRVLLNLGIVCSNHGKHLLIKDPHTGNLFDMSFGLYGKIKVTNDLKITKVCIKGKPCGDAIYITTFQEARDRLGIDWVGATREQLLRVVKSWGHRKKKISMLLVDQSQIAGIGKHWVDEILRVAMIDATIKAHTLDFLNLTGVLVDALIKVRDTTIHVYMNSVPKDELKFVNEWFKQ